jgi:hypothetical protein
MGKWRGFLDSLATTGGHIFSLMFLILFGVLVAMIGFMAHWDAVYKLGDTIAAGSFGGLLMMYKPSGTNSEQIARAGVPYQPPQPPPASLHPPIVVADPPLPPSTTEGAHP